MLGPLLLLGWVGPSFASLYRFCLGPLGVGGPAGRELCSYCIGYGINPIPYMLCQVLINIYSSNPPRFINHYVTRPSRATIIIYTRTCVKVNNIIISHLTFIIPSKCPCYPLIILFSFVKYPSCYAIF